MTIDATIWAFKLENISPLAKLLAIRLADCGPTSNLVELAAWCNTTFEELIDAIEELGTYGIEYSISGLILNCRLPAAAIPLTRDTSSRPKVDRSDHNLYVISCGDRTKVGIAKDVKFRLKTIQGLSPEKMKAKWHASGPAFLIRQAERMIHQALQKHRLDFSPEWFSLPFEEVVSVAKDYFEKIVKNEQ